MLGLWSPLIHCPSGEHIWPWWKCMIWGGLPQRGHPMSPPPLGTMGESVQRPDMKQRPAQSEGRHTAIRDGWKKRGWDLKPRHGTSRRRRRETQGELTGPSRNISPLIPGFSIPAVTLLEMVAALEAALPVALPSWRRARHPQLLWHRHQEDQGLAGASRASSSTTNPEHLSVFLSVSAGYV